MTEVDDAGGSQESSGIDARPIGIHGGDVVDVRPKAPEEVSAYMNKGDEIDTHPNTCKAPTRVRHCCPRIRSTATHPISEIM